MNAALQSFIPGTQSRMSTIQELRQRDLRSLRWLAVIVLFQTGLQKVLYGHYLHGDFLTFMAATNQRFAALLGWVIEPAALESLSSMDVFRTGSGPFRTGSPALRIGSNGVVLAELALPVLMVVVRTRVAAMLAAIALVVAIQTGARELGFALLFSNLLLLFTPTDWNGRLLPVWAALLILTLVSVVGFGAEWLDPGML